MLKIKLPPFLGVFARTDQEDPIKVFRYTIAVDNFSRFGFSKMTGLKATTEEVKYREGTMNTTPQKSPGITTFSDVTFERGVVISPGQGAFDMIIWYTQVFDVSSKNASSARAFRRTIEVTQNFKDGTVALQWRLVEAWPKEIEPFPDLDAMTSNDDIEKMVICHEGFQLLTPVT